MQFLHTIIFAVAAMAASTCKPVFQANTPIAYCPPRPATPAEQVAIFNQFIQTAYIEKNATKALLTHMSEDYIQHNTDVLSGRQNGIDALSGFLPMANFTILRQAFDNNLGWLHTKTQIPGAPVASIVDILRFEGTCIMEHWDVLQFMPANATNPLALF